ncbi:MAG TPA: DUF6642 family protein [Nocardioidaceae bacterium]
MAGATKGVFCLEGAWERRLDDRCSVLPTLELLERLGLARFIHRDVGTKEELFHYLNKWKQRGYSGYEALYFAFHGTKGGIAIGRGTITLDELAEHLEGSAKGRIVYFGACNVMRDRSAVEAFAHMTKAKAVCGFTKEVDWVESSAFDLLLLDSLLDGKRIDARINTLRRRYPDLTRRLGFETYPQFDRVASGTNGA